MTGKSPLAPGSRIGILGGGQLGRMLSMAAAQLGFHVSIYCPEAYSPAAEVSSSHVQADYEDADALKQFAESVDVLTYEFENVPAEPLKALETIVPVYPSVQALEKTQDRLVEKSFLQDLGIAVTPFRNIENEADLRTSVSELGAPAMLKTRRFGYDGKGQARITRDSDLGDVYKEFDGVPAILEAFIDFQFEISIVAVRGRDGQVLTYDISRNHHADQILRTSDAPAGVSADIQAMATEAASRFATAVDYVGVFAVEFFYCGDEVDTPLLVNEIAPRVHNTGHWTMDACVVGQFENHIRAIVGWPLGDVSRHSDAQMVNLIGNDMLEWERYAGEPDCAVHIYGKDDVREGRKMGHVNIIKAKG